MSERFSWQGTIRRLYVIACAACSAEDKVEFFSRQDSERFWQQQGWHKQNGQWYCRNCRPKRGEG